MSVEIMWSHTDATLTCVFCSEAIPPNHVFVWVMEADVWDEEGEAVTGTSLADICCDCADRIGLASSEAQDDVDEEWEEHKRLAVEQAERLIEGLGDAQA